MTEDRHRIVLRWAWFGLAVVVLVVLAHMHRYEIQSVGGGGAIAWDRWQHRMCYGIALQDVRCTQDADSTDTN